LHLELLLSPSTQDEKATLFQVAFLVSAPPPSGRGGWEIGRRAAGFFFGNVELSLELWTVIAGISRFDD